MLQALRSHRFFKQKNILYLLHTVSFSILVVTVFYGYRLLPLNFEIALVLELAACYVTFALYDALVERRWDSAKSFYWAFWMAPWTTHPMTYRTNGDLFGRTGAGIGFGVCGTTLLWTTNPWLSASSLLGLILALLTGLIIELNLRDNRFVEKLVE